MNTQNPSPEEVALLISRRLKKFWGYGNLKGSVWLIGMEEGIGADEDFPITRFESTSGKEVVDITDNTAEDHNRWFKSGAATQRTWRPLIFILLYQTLGRAPTLEEIRDYQINHFGRKNSDHAILELMPLPSRSLKASDWIYSDVQLTGLKNRKEYLAMYKPERVKLLQALIEKHQPKLVLFYSRSYLPDWQSIVPKTLKEVIPEKLHVAKVGGTTYAVTAHPVSHGLSTKDWEMIARKVL